MRLLTKTTLYFLVAMLVLLTAGGVYLFKQFSKAVDRQTDQDLITDEVQWIRYLQTQADAGRTFVLRTSEILIFPSDQQVQQFPSFAQTRGFSARQNKEVPYRQLSHVVGVRGIPYQVTIRKSQEQKSDFVTSITKLLMIVFAGMLIITLVINWIISKTIWKPFTLSLQKIRGAELSQMKAMHFGHTGIREFNELNESLNFMVGKIYNDYINMKEFTENAAHEMQTPLAIVQSKIELLLQDPALTDEQAANIVQAANAVKRLSNLNQSLLLLARIENHQYDTDQLINLNDVTSRYLQQFSEIIKQKAVKVTTTFNADLLVQLHPLLADSLISNLLGNAIKYNHENGQVHIKIDVNRLAISNTSIQPPLMDEQLFKRFNKQAGDRDTSNGLGLAIVKKICDNHRLHISYAFVNGMHAFTIVKLGTYMQTNNAAAIN